MAVTVLESRLIEVIADCGAMNEVKKELVMTLAIVWRNPKPLIKTKQTVRRIQADRSCAVYAITDAKRTQEFSLISSEVA